MINKEFSSFIPEDFSGASRVWIYQSSRLFTIGEALEIEVLLNEFITGWKAHGAQVKGFGNLFFGRFIVLMADEATTEVSGCSTDSSVRLIKQIETQFGVSMFDRQSLAFVVKEKIQILPLAQLNYAFENNFIEADTLYFNNLVTTKDQLLNEWIIPVKNSWLSKRIKSITV